MSSKGQMFLILATIIFSSLVAIVLAVNTNQFSYTKKQLETEYEKAFYLALKKELAKAIEINSQQTNVTDSLKNFASFTRDRVYSKSLQFKLFSSQAIFKNVTANANVTMNVSILNMLGETMSSLYMIFSYDNSSQTVSSLADNSTYYTQFIFNTSSDRNYTLNISYTATTSRIYNVTIPVVVGEGKIVSLFDFQLEAAIASYREEFVENYRLT